MVVVLILKCLKYFNQHISIDKSNRKVATVIVAITEAINAHMYNAYKKLCRDQQLIFYCSH